MDFYAALDFQPIAAAGCVYALILFFNFPEHLNVTTLLGARIISSPVMGFLPLRSRLSLTQNLPNPLTRTSSPDASVDLMISRRVSKFVKKITCYITCEEF